MYPADVVLCEGILVFYQPEVRQLFDMKLFVDTDADTRLSRRVRRDTRERGRDLDMVLEQYTNLVKPAFEEFCLPVSGRERGVRSGREDEWAFNRCNLCNVIHNGNWGVMFSATFSRWEITISIAKLIANNHQTGEALPVIPLQSPVKHFELTVSAQSGDFPATVGSCRLPCSGTACGTTPLPRYPSRCLCGRSGAPSPAARWLAAIPHPTRRRSAALPTWPAAGVGVRGLLWPAPGGGSPVTHLGPVPAMSAAAAETAANCVGDPVRCAGQPRWSGSAEKAA